MTSEVGSGQVAVFATFKGVRASIGKFFDDSTDDAGKSFKTGFTKAATSTGTSAGKSFKDSFSTASSGIVSAATDQVAKASRELATVRSKELDVTGKVRLAESQLAEARSKYADGSSQVIRAEERLATASRQLVTAQDSVKASTDKLSTAKKTLASASADAATSSGGLGGVLSRLPSFFSSAGMESARSFGSSFRTNIGQIATGSFLGITAADIGRTIGQVIAVGATEAIASVQNASDLSETASAVTQVYGDAAADIKAFASTANTTLGQTRVQSLKAAQTFGVFAKQAGLTGKPLASFSTGLVTLSADLASFYNSSPDEAIEAIGAGLRGEAEPLRRFGVLLDDATLRAKALELGIYDGNDALTGQQRILAAQAVIFDQTGIAQGDFARTSDGLANQQRILAASLEDTKTKFGEALLPAFTTAATFANETLVPALDGLVSHLGPVLGQALIDAGPKFDDLWAKAEPLIDGFLTSAAEDGIPAFIDLMNDVVTEAPKWAKALNDAAIAFEEFDKKDDYLTQILQDELKRIGNDLGGAYSDSGLDAGGSFGNAFVDGLGEKAPAAADAAGSLATSAVTAAQSQSGALTGAGGQLGSGFVAGMLSKEAEVEAAAITLGDAAVRSMSTRLRIASPSKVTEQLGLFTGKGFVKGIIGSIPEVQRATADMVAIAEYSSSSSGMLLSMDAVAGRPIYVQNPFTGEYLLAQVDGRAQAAVTKYDKDAGATTRGGRI